MDQQARDEITAAGAVHRELGPGYDDAVAEGLVERIGEEIDKRVDARLAQYSGRPAPHIPPAPHSAPPAPRGPGGQVSPAARPPWAVVVLALGSMLMGTLASAAVLNSHGSGSVVALVWIVIAVINVAYARRH
ncbi:MAG TPA: hypothetical protein VGF54_19085 [Streptosporangiaceae bacterium]